MNFDAVIFDLDDVLCHLDDVARIAYLQTLTGRSATALKEAIWASGFESRSDVGEFTADEYLQRFGEKIGYPLSESQWITYRKSGMTPIPETLALVARVARETEVAILTNNGLMLKKHIDALFPELRPLFGEHIYASAEFGTKKPDPQIYIALCARLGVEPGRAAFVDDRPENVRGAQRAGLSGHAYFWPHDLAAFLGLAP